MSANRTARYVDDVKRAPVDRVARMVTSPGPKWCAPGEKVEQALERLVGTGTALAMRGHITNPKTGRLFDSCTPEQVVVYARLFVGRSSTLGQRIGFLRLVLGLPLKKHHIFGLGRLGIRPAGAR